jgi:hypothetical protein
MPDIYQSYKTFISSPGDVAEERQAAKDAISRINITCRDLLGVSLEPKTWEDMPPVAPKFTEERIQDVLNREVEKCQFFVLILYKRYGSTEPGHTISNTEREIETILAQFEKKPQIRILIYFRNLPSNVDQGKQEQKVRDFRKRLEDKGLIYKSYDTPEEFRNIIAHDLYEVVLRLRLSPTKRLALQHFWKFGEVDPPTNPKLAILFPPIQRMFMGGKKSDLIWQQRLNPNVYYEDYKSILKVTKTLNLIGFRDHRTYFQSDPPADLAVMNKVWLCFGRSNFALTRIDAKYRHARFRFSLRKESSEYATWFLKGGKPYQLRSPLNTYLRIQRSKMDSKGSWNQQLGKVVAKDYGILARFHDREADARTTEGALHDYYIGGIRGLGTWGVSWFIDRKHKELLKYPEDQDLQSLLEITYHDGKIVDAVDVSDRPKEYFMEQNTVKLIRETIDQFRS